MSNVKRNFDVTNLAAALIAEDQADLLNELKNKLLDVAGQDSDFSETFNPEVNKRVELLRDIQEEHDEVEEKYFEERAALEAKYQKLYQPFYAKRYEIVNGLTAVGGDVVPMEEGEKASSEKGVPNFWFLALRNHEVLMDEITARDEGALKYLKDVKWCKIDESKGFKLEFLFGINPYFKNTFLTKVYHMVEEDEPILEKAIGTKIEWYPGKCLTEKKPMKRAKNGKPDTETEECESFFNFFNPPKVPEPEQELDDKAVEKLQTEMENDYDIGATIRDKIIPHAVSWYTGEAMEGDDFDDDDDEDDLILDEDEDEDEDEDGETVKDEEDGEQVNPKKQKNEKLEGGTSC